MLKLEKGFYLCPVCKETLSAEKEEDKLPNFCPNCGFSVIAATKGKTSKTSNAKEKSLKTKEKVLFELGRYRVLSHLGQGGQGQVLLAEDAFTEKKVVIKRIRPNKVNTPEAFKRLSQAFDKEASLLKRLNHPNIIPILDHQKDELGDYFVMPFIEGEALSREIEDCKRQELTHRSLPKKFATPYAIGQQFLKICKIAAYAHENQILHGDIKPDNLLVAKDDELVLIDWGLAFDLQTVEKEKKAIKEKLQQDKAKPQAERMRSLQNLKQKYQILKGAEREAGGTLPFMAPELLKGGKLTIETEIYALGATFYFLLMFEAPFHRVDAKIRAGDEEVFLRESLQNPSERLLNRGIPPLFAEIIEKCLAFDPKKRFSSVQPILQLMERYLSGEPDWELVKTITPETKPSISAHLPFSEAIAFGATVQPQDWHFLSLFKAPEINPCKIEAEVKLKKGSQGFGLIIGASGEDPKFAHQTGFFLWLSTDKEGSGSLKKFGFYLDRWKNHKLPIGKPLQITFSRRNGTVQIFLNGENITSVPDILSTRGVHFGMIAQDHSYELEKLRCLTSPASKWISPLAIGKALQSNGKLKEANAQFEKDQSCFSFAEEGAEALFLKGINEVLIAREEGKKEGIQEKYKTAFKTFSSLKNTLEPSLEYLGKALIYESEGDDELEIAALNEGMKTLNALSSRWEEHLFYRLNYFASTERLYALTLLKGLLDKYSASYLQVRLPYLFYQVEKLVAKLPFLFFDFKQKGKETLFKRNELKWALPLSFLLKQAENYTPLLDLWLHLNEALMPMNKEVALSLLASLFEMGSYYVVEEKITLFKEHLLDLLKNPEAFVDPHAGESAVVAFTLDEIVQREVTGEQFRKETSEKKEKEEVDEKTLAEKLKNLVRNELAAYEKPFEQMEGVIAVFKTPRIKTTQKALETFSDHLNPFEIYLLKNLCEFLLIDHHIECVLAVTTFIEKKKLKKPLKEFFIFHLWGLMLSDQFEKVRAHFDRIPLEELADPASPLHFVYGGYLAATENDAIASIHFKSCVQTFLPDIIRLGSHFLAEYLGHDSPFWEQATDWEKRQLFFQLALYYRLISEQKLADEAKKQYEAHGKKPYET